MPEPTESRDGLERLVRLLDLEQVDRDIFRGANRRDDAPGRVFGGQVASQALRAAAATVDAAHRVNSLHAYFLRPGRHGSPIVYTVDRIRDGSSFTTRRVVAVQQGEPILNLDASFHKDEPGHEFQLPSPVADAPPPETLERNRHQHGPHQRPIDMRDVVPPVSPLATRAHWVRADGALPDDPVLHACVVTYFSDSGPVGAARRAIGGWERDGGPRMMTASLDHCLWFHRPVRADEWLYYELEAVACTNARGLARGEMWTQDGTLAVTVTQESLLRPLA
ncbi:MAG TPA: acyl-CoA thioesterase domain-containing protein [Acidimicrobiales bacterium]